MPSSQHYSHSIVLHRSIALILRYKFKAISAKHRGADCHNFSLGEPSNISSAARSIACARCRRLDCAWYPAPQPLRAARRTGNWSPVKSAHVQVYCPIIPASSCSRMWQSNMKGCPSAHDPFCGKNCSSGDDATSNYIDCIVLAGDRSAQDHQSIHNDGQHSQIANWPERPCEQNRTCSMETWKRYQPFKVIQPNTMQCPRA